jgi:FKBP-type peptidyl-prolyl cis-trans isomerase
VAPRAFAVEQAQRSTQNRRFPMCRAIIGPPKRCPKLAGAGIIEGYPSGYVADKKHSTPASAKPKTRQAGLSKRGATKPRRQSAAKPKQAGTDAKGKYRMARTPRSVTRLIIKDLSRHGHERRSMERVGRALHRHITNGKKFDSSRRSRRSFDVSAWEQETVIEVGSTWLVGMRVGGKRRLTIPSSLAYGKMWQPAGYPPDATLIFDVTLLTRS